MDLRRILCPALKRQAAGGDPVGNRLSETRNGTVNTYTYPTTNNRLTNVKQGTTTTRAFLYNARGDVTRDTRGATAYNYAVNNAGRIRTLTIGTTLRATWTYDGFQKLRIKAATSPAATTHYIWDSFGHIIAEHNATGGAALKQYVWLGDTPLAVFDNTTLYYVHPDHLDRPVVMTNAAAMTVAWQAKYDPFGVPVAVTVTPTNNQRLPGQWFQSEDGLAYNWHRTYDPTLGRYTQADPLGFVDGPGVYDYASQSPLMVTDPSGECPWCLAGFFAGLAFEYFTNGDCATWEDYAVSGLLSALPAAPFGAIKAYKYFSWNKYARSAYPKLADKIHKHHIWPKYLGGSLNGPLAELNGAYHQMITNAFRQEWKYRIGPPKPEQAAKIMKKVYKELPLTWW